MLLKQSKRKFLLISLSIVTLFSVTTSKSALSQQSDTLMINNFLYGVAHFNSGKIELAQEFFQKVVATDRTNSASLYYLAQIHNGKGEFKESIELLKSALEIEPENIEYLKMLAQYLIEEGRELNEALSMIERIEKRERATETLEMMRFEILSRLGREEEAIDKLTLVEKEIESPRLAIILGNWWAEKEQNSKAEHYFLKALEQVPDYAPINFGLAEIYRIEGKFDLYFKYLYRFLSDSDVDPNMKRGYIGQIMENRKFVQTFLPQVDSIWSLAYNAHPSDTAIGNNYAIFLVQSGKEREGEKILQTTSNLYPESKSAAHHYLSLLYFQERWEAVVEQSNRILKYQPTNPNFLQFKGIAQLQLGEVESSIETFKSVLRHSQDSATTVNTLTTLGDLSYKAKRVKEAYKYYKRAIKREPNNLPALNNYSYYLSLEGKQLKKAAKMSKVTIELEPDNPTYLDTYAWIEYKLGNYEEAKIHLKRAMLFGGKEQAEIVNHYASVLYAMGEHELAFFHWDKADKLDPSKGIAEKVRELREKGRGKR